MTDPTTIAKRMAARHFDPEHIEGPLDVLEQITRAAEDAVREAIRQEREGR